MRPAVRAMTPEEEQTRDIRVFCKEAKCSPEEARYYLSASEWNFLAALAEFRADKQWGDENPQHLGGKKTAECVVL